jgi:hypothetical protein
MKNIEPLSVITAVVSAALLLVIGRYAVTGDLNKDLLSILATVFGGLITALSTRGKGGNDKEDQPDE